MRHLYPLQILQDGNTCFYNKHQVQIQKRNSKAPKPKQGSLSKVKDKKPKLKLLEELQ